MLWATMLAGTDVVLHAAGWLEGGLTASLEKFALDVELLEQLQVQQAGVGFSEEEFAFDALEELGPGGLWLAAQHTMDHFKEWQYMLAAVHHAGLHDVVGGRRRGDRRRARTAGGRSCSRPTRTPASTPTSTRS